MTNDDLSQTEKEDRLNGQLKEVDRLAKVLKDRRKQLLKKLQRLSQTEEGRAFEVQK